MCACICTSAPCGVSIGSVRASKRIPFYSNYRLARRILCELKPLLPKAWQVHLYFDSWYAERLIKCALRQGWHVTCGLKCNRTLNGLRLDQLATRLRYRRYTQVRVSATDGKTSTCYVRQTTGRLTDLPDDIRVFFSKQHPSSNSKFGFRRAIFVNVHRFTADFGATMRLPTAATWLAPDDFDLHSAAHRAHTRTSSPKKSTGGLQALKSWPERPLEAHRVQASQAR